MSEVSRRPGSILVVEDEDLLREAFREFLETEGFRVLSARDGRSALDVLASTQDVTLILLDFQMPVMNGIEFRKRQLEDPRIAAIPVIGLTGGPGGDADATRLKIWTVLRKPVTLDQLLAALEHADKARGQSSVAPLQSLRAAKDAAGPL